MRKTLLAVGFAVLASLMFVPHGSTSHGMVHYARRAAFFIETGRPVLFVPFLLQTAFAAVATAIIVNINWRCWKPRPSTVKKIGVFLLIFAFLAALVLTAWLDFPAFQHEMKRRAEGEEWAARGGIDAGKFESAKQHLLKAADYWWWKGWWEGARDARQRALDEQGMKKHAAAFRAKRDAAAQVKATPAFDPAHPFDDLIPQGGRSGGKYLSTDPNAGFDPDSYLARKSGAKDIFDVVQWEEEEKLVHAPIDYQTGTTGTDSAYVVAKFFERNLGDRKPELDASRSNSARRNATR
jgi:hypothetical protein